MIAAGGCSSAPTRISAKAARMRHMVERGPVGRVSSAASAGERNPPTETQPAGYGSSSLTRPAVSIRAATEHDLPAVLAIYAQPGVDDGAMLGLDQARA